MKKPQSAQAAAAELLRKQCHIGTQVMGPTFTAAFDSLALQVNAWMNAQGFWESSNSGEKIALMHSELSEALEADRKDLDDQHLPQFKGVAVELADVIIRIMDYAAQHQLPVGEALQAKIEYNLTRPFRHGKKY